MLGGLAVGVALIATATAVTIPSPTPTHAARNLTSVSAEHADRRGELVSARHLRTMSARKVAKTLASDRFDAGMVRYGVDTYRLVYRTVDTEGQPTTASGLLVLPRNHDRRLRTVSFAHGTEINKRYAPSVAKDVWGSAPAITYASAGFAAVAPDYLGLGVGPGPHPWKDVPSETTASLDMLRAARDFVPRTGRSLRREVLATGFSQGASAALGLARALQEGADERFELRAVAPISGAYDFQHAQLPAMLDGKLHPKMSVGYTAYLLVAWNRLHHLYDEPGELIKAPYDRTIEALFDGHHTGEQFIAGIPDDLDSLLTPRAVDMLRHPTGRLAEALRVDASVCTDWTPTVPIRLYVSDDDREATVVNSHHCQASLRSRGVDAPIISVGDVDHTDSNRLGTAAVVRWFDRLR
jgi:hypothetical protein